jgi:hypothetical protein
MKKNVLGLFAIVLAISLSAFNTIHKEKTTGTPFYWYQVSGTSTIGSTLNPSAAVDKPTAMSDLTNCDDQATDNCLFGSTNANLPNNTNIGTPDPEQLIKERP